MAAASGWSPQNPDAFPILRGLFIGSDLEHAGVEARPWWRPRGQRERFDQDRAGVPGLDDGVDPAARGAVPDISLLDVVLLHPLPERGELLRRAVGAVSGEYLEDDVARLRRPHDRVARVG